MVSAGGGGMRRPNNVEFTPKLNFAHGRVPARVAKQRGGGVRGVSSCNTHVRTHVCRLFLPDIVGHFFDFQDSGEQHRLRRSLNSLIKL